MWTGISFLGSISFFSGDSVSILGEELVAWGGGVPLISSCGTRMISFVIVEDFSNQVLEIETKVPPFTTNLRIHLPNFGF